MIEKFFLAVLLLSVSTIPQEGSAEDLKEIGSFFTCAHNLSGKVFAKNDRQLVIKNFEFDGKGLAPWFHGMYEGSQIIANHGDKQKALPNLEGKCDRLVEGKVYSGQEVTLNLPESIKKFETIGVLCYDACVNFGHVIIPKNLDVPPAPENSTSVEGCLPPSFAPCMFDQIKFNRVKSECPVGNPKNGGANQNKSVPIFGIIAVLGFFLGHSYFY